MLSVDNAAKSSILAISLSVLHNYSDDPTILFLDLYLVKFLDSSAKVVLSEQR